MLLNVLRDQRIIFVGGKGGAGKTTVAASLATRAADMGRKCLIISTDPAHSLGDIFDISIGHNQTLLSNNLWGMEINPDLEVSTYLSTVKDNLKKLVHPKMYEAVNNQIDLSKHAPGSTEAALLERVAELMANPGDKFDLIVFDTAPTGHTIRLLSLPETMALWIDGLLKHQEKSQKLNTLLNSLDHDQNTSRDLPLTPGINQDLKNDTAEQIRTILLARRQKFSLARELLLDTTNTAFLLVLNPNKLSILESSRAIETLKQFNLPITAIVVNRILPDEAEGDFLRRRRHEEEKHKRDIEKTFRSWHRINLPLLPHDVHGIEILRQAGQYLVGT